VPLCVGCVQGVLMNYLNIISYMLMFYGAYSLTVDMRRKFKDLWKKNKKHIYDGMSVVMD